MKRLAQKIRVPRLIHDFSGGFGEGPTGPQVDEVWIPPGEPEVTGMEDFDLPIPDVSTFQIAGVDIDVGRSPYATDEVGVRILLHVKIKGEDWWSSISSFRFFRMNKDPEARALEWKSFIHDQIASVVDHELDESLLFGGKHYREPHPGRTYARPTDALKLSDIPKDILMQIVKKRD